MRIDTEDDDEDYVLVAVVTRCENGCCMSGELHTEPGAPAAGIVKLLTDLADKHLKDASRGQVGLEIVSASEFRAKVEEAARLKGAYSNVLAFGAPARGPARRWS